MHNSIIGYMLVLAVLLLNRVSTAFYRNCIHREKCCYYYAIIPQRIDRLAYLENEQFLAAIDPSAFNEMHIHKCFNHADGWVHTI